MYNPQSFDNNFGENMKKLLLLSILCVLSYTASAEIVSIPMQYTGQPAKDLVDSQKKPLSVMEAKLVWARTHDLSNLNPKETDIWKDNIGKTLRESDDNLSIDSRETFKYIDKVISSVGTFRFVARETKGAKRNLNIWLSKDSRSILLRKNLLRKLGYTVPKIQHQQKVKIKFKGKASMDAFLEEVQNGTFADSDRWRVNTDEEKFVLTLQDVLIYEANTKLYNLAMGEVNDSVLLHRRVMNTLAIPFSIVDLRESVDGFPWSVGKLNNKVVLLDIISGDAFTTTYYDALWMIKRLSKLTRKDFEEIVSLSYFPKSVRLLMVEKLISRFNSLEKIFDKDAKIIKVNHTISDGSGELVQGRLTQDNWDGHAARYSFDDTESPLSKDEMTAYFKSKFYSGVIQNLVTHVNENYLYNTDIQKSAIEQAVKAQKQQFLDFFETGQFKRVPYSAWIVPTAKGNISASRDIITGSYLGTDNLIQIADSIEFIGEVGAFVGTLGLPIEAQVYAVGGARFSRAYTHVKSIKSIKKALKEPFRNIIVPDLKRRKSKSIIQMIDSLQSKEFAALEEEERSTELDAIFKEFNKVLEVGDSIIISNNLITSGTLIGGYKIPVGRASLEAMLQMNARRVNLWRLHITRSNENTFQVYKSKVNSFGKGFGFQLKAYVPIISLNWDKQSGRIVTRFHSVEFDKTEKTKETVKKLIQLRQVFVENSTELMHKAKKPFIIQHDFTEDSRNSRVLTKQNKKVELLDKLKITHPENYETEFYIRSITRLTGKNYIQVAYDVLNAIIQEVFEEDNVSFQNAESGNPGDSFHGESYSRQSMTEVPYNHEDSEIPFENYAHVKSQWKGWSASRGKLVSIKEQIDKKYGKGIFNDELFYDTDLIKLYTVNVTLSLYAGGIQHMIDFDHDKLMNLVNDEIVIPWPKGKSHFVRRGHRRGFNKYRRTRSKVIQRISAAHNTLRGSYSRLVSPAQKSKSITLLIDSMESMMPFKTFSTIVGGDENYYLKGGINGFRVGTENGEESIVSHAIGEFGSEFTGGILDTLRNAIKISQGELGAYWFLRRIQ